MSLLQEAAQDFNVPARLLASVIDTESSGNPHAVSPVGAQGLGQLMPGTAEGLGVRDPFDVRQNIGGTARYLSQLIKHFHGDLRLAVAAYNAGPGAVEKHGGVPPFAETQNYVQRVMGLYGGH